MKYAIKKYTTLIIIKDKSVSGSTYWSSIKSTIREILLIKIFNKCHQTEEKEKRSNHKKDFRERAATFTSDDVISKSELEGDDVFKLARS